MEARDRARDERSSTTPGGMYKAVEAGLVQRHDRRVGAQVPAARRRRRADHRRRQRLPGRGRQQRAPASTRSPTARAMQAHIDAFKAFKAQRSQAAVRARAGRARARRRRRRATTSSAAWSRRPKPAARTARSAARCGASWASATCRRSCEARFSRVRTEPAWIAGRAGRQAQRHRARASARSSAASAEAGRRGALRWRCRIWAAPTCSASPARPAPASRRWSMRCWASCWRAASASPSWRSIRPARLPAAPCSATASAWASTARTQNVFIRSVASRGHLGGLSRTTAAMVDVLDAAGFDIVIVETVGAGQSEVEIACAWRIRGLCVCPPGLGDDVQALKAGILEIADVLVVTKSDLPGGEPTARDLKDMLHLRAAGPSGSWVVPVINTSATTGAGVKEAVDAVERHAAHAGRGRRLQLRPHPAPAPAHEEPGARVKRLGRCRPVPALAGRHLHRRGSRHGHGPSHARAAPHQFQRHLPRRRDLRAGRHRVWPGGQFARPGRRRASTRT